MNCEEERKLYKLKMDAENEFRRISLPIRTKPLGIEIPKGHIFTKERRHEIQMAEERRNAIIKTYQKHIKICSICGN